MKLTVRVMDRIRGKIEERMKACMAVRYSFNQMTGVMRVFLYLEPGLVLSEELTEEEAGAGEAHGVRRKSGGI